MEEEEEIILFFYSDFPRFEKIEEEPFHYSISLEQNMRNSSLLEISLLVHFLTPDRKKKISLDLILTSKKSSFQFEEEISFLLIFIIKSMNDRHFSPFTPNQPDQNGVETAFR